MHKNSENCLICKICGTTRNVVKTDNLKDLFLKLRKFPHAQLMSSRDNKDVARIQVEFKTTDNYTKNSLDKILEDECLGSVSWEQMDIENFKKSKDGYSFTFPLSFDGSTMLSDDEE